MGTIIGNGACVLAGTAAVAVAAAVARFLDRRWGWDRVRRQLIFTTAFIVAFGAVELLTVMGGS